MVTRERQPVDPGPELTVGGEPLADPGRHDLDLRVGQPLPQGQDDAHDSRARVVAGFAGMPLHIRLP